MACGKGHSKKTCNHLQEKNTVLNGEKGLLNLERCDIVDKVL
jgi:hypothetical protein